MVYRDVNASLEGKEATPGSFDLMNKGITILALGVRLLDKDEQIYEVTVDDKEGGIGDGAHTAKIIEKCNADGTTHPTNTSKSSSALALKMASSPISPAA